MALSISFWDVRKILGMGPHFVLNDLLLLFGEGVVFSFKGSDLPFNILSQRVKREFTWRLATITCTIQIQHLFHFIYFSGVVTTSVWFYHHEILPFQFCHVNLQTGFTALLNIKKNVLLLLVKRNAKSDGNRCNITPVVQLCPQTFILFHFGA